MRASVDGQLVPIPINLDTVNQLYGLNLTSFELTSSSSPWPSRATASAPRKTSIVSKVGRELYEKFFRNYTRKQWGLDPSELDATVTARVPVRTNRDDRYFTDTYQVDAAARLHADVREHAAITRTSRSCSTPITARSRTSFRIDEMIYTGPVDEFFDYRFGKLPYRSLEFKHETHERAPRTSPRRSSTTRTSTRTRGSPSSST